ncbi:hypothetical protein HU734_002695 [Pseudomonas wayambapalatensis]|uniref:hypothetical protein n=1 Tax=Pseudomonas wayambapalatensis TaxID=485895 RepID=UPI00164885B2|nr:hypothetical protein HU734_002695 [Pseudomonas wayambapalatensis]
MASFAEFYKILKASPPLRRIKLLLLVMVCLVASAALYFSGWEVYRMPDVSRQTVIEGRVSGYPSSWEHNRSIVRFAVAYKLDGVTEGKPIYLYQKLYEQSGLRINSKVLLNVERLEEGSMVRELATLDGRVLYNDRLHRQVVAWNNKSIRAIVVMLGLVSILIALAMLVIAVRHRRELFQAG